MTERNIFVYKFFAIKYFRFIFSVKTALRSPSSKNWGAVQALYFENLVGGSTPTSSRKLGWTLCNCLTLTLTPLTRFSPGLFVVLQEILYHSYCKSNAFSKCITKELMASFENYKLLLFFWLPRKLSSRLILTP